MDTEISILRVLSESIRLRLATLLAMEGEVCVCRLAAAVGEPQYKVSRHLGIMRAAGLVEARREGTWMYYQLAKPVCALQRHLFIFLADGFEDNPVIASDRERLRLTDLGKKVC
jgi:ArsR family transcriptional regulator